jgi:hypothetical protein
MSRSKTSTQLSTTTPSVLGMMFYQSLINYKLIRLSVGEIAFAGISGLGSVRALMVMPYVGLFPNATTIDNHLFDFTYVGLLLPSMV